MFLPHASRGPNRIQCDRFLRYTYLLYLCSEKQNTHSIENIAEAERNSEALPPTSQVSRGCPFFCASQFVNRA